MKGCKVCCIIILIVFLLVAGASAFLLLYTPSASKLAEKLVSDSTLVTYYEEGKTDYSTKINQLLSFINDNFETEFNFKEVVEFSSVDGTEEEKAIEGYIFYMDSIATTFKVEKEYIQFLRNKEKEETDALQLHFSPRGKALFVGNLNAELEFRKIIF